MACSGRMLSLPSKRDLISTYRSWLSGTQQVLSGMGSGWSGQFGWDCCQRWSSQSFSVHLLLQIEPRPCLVCHQPLVNPLCHLHHCIKTYCVVLSTFKWQRGQVQSRSALSYIWYIWRNALLKSLHWWNCANRENEARTRGGWELSDQINMPFSGCFFFAAQCAIAGLEKKVVTTEKERQDPCRCLHTTCRTFLVEQECGIGQLAIKGPYEDSARGLQI